MIMLTPDNLRAILLQAQLCHNEVHRLMLIFSQLHEDEQKEIVRFLQEQPAWAKKLSNAIKAKKKALATGNKEVWGKYITSEERVLLEASSLSESDSLKK